MSQDSIVFKMSFEDSLSSNIKKYNQQEKTRFVSEIIQESSNKFTNYYFKLLFTPKNEIDISLVSFSLIMPINKLSNQQLKRMISLAPSTSEWDISENLNANISKSIPFEFHSPINKLNLLLFKGLSEIRIFDLSNQLINKLQINSHEIPQLNIDSIKQIKEIVSELFKNYNQNQIERLFSSRHYFSLYPILILKIYNTNNKINLPIIKTFEELLSFVIDKKELAHPSIININNAIQDNFKFFVPISADEFKLAADIYNNCLSSYIMINNEDIITVYDCINRKPLACISIENSQIKSIMGVSNIQLSDSIIKTLAKILINYNIIERQYY